MTQQYSQSDLFDLISMIGNEHGPQLNACQTATQQSVMMNPIFTTLIFGAVENSRLLHRAIFKSIANNILSL